MNRKTLIIGLFVLTALSGGAIAVQAGPRPTANMFHGALMASPAGPEARGNPTTPKTIRSELASAPGSPLAPQAALTTTFTYQGHLAVSGSPANGQYDLKFVLWDAPSGGSPVGTPFLAANQTVSDGLFTVQLDFGAGAFQGDARWLEISVKIAGGPTYTLLSPRQPMTAAPYALGLMPGAVISGTLGAGSAIVTASNSGAGYGLSGQNSSGSGAGVYGSNTNAGTGAGVSGAGYYGVSGQSSAGPNGAGVYGLSTNTTDGSGVWGTGYYGVRGNSSNGYGVSGAGPTGVFGIATSTGFGVMGQSTNTAIYGVSTGSGFGVYGTSGGSGSGIYGVNTGSGGGYGVQGAISSTFGYGVYGSNTGSGGTGVYGAGYYGVQGQSSSSAGYGVLGSNTSGVGVRGDSSASDGVFGNTSAAGGRAGVHGVAFTGNNDGVYGYSANLYGVHGESTNDAGVLGINLGTGVNSKGVWGYSLRVGVFGSTIDGIGVLAAAGSITGTALSAQNTGGGVGVGASATGTGDAVTASAENGYGVYSYSINGAGVLAVGSIIGVQGVATSASGIGVEASGSGTNTALQIDNGAIKVSGTNQPVFVHIATAGNTSGNTTEINNLFSNGDPNAILIVTPNWGPNSVYDSHPIGVFYNGARWAIFHQDLAAMQVGAAFNVLVVKR